MCKTSYRTASISSLGYDRGIRSLQWFSTCCWRQSLVNYSASNSISQMCTVADNIVFTNRSKQSMIQRNNTLVTEAQKNVLQINTSKTKYMVNTREPDTVWDFRISVCQQELVYGRVEYFIYLDTNLNSLKTTEEQKLRSLAVYV